MATMILARPPDRTPNLAALSPVELADVVLLEALARTEGSVVLAPASAELYHLRHEGRPGDGLLATVPADSAKATLLRLAIIAGEAFAPPLIAKLPIRLASHRGASDGTRILFLTIRTSASGPLSEIVALDHDRTWGQVGGVEGLDYAASEPKYRVLEELGRGGMGIVYLARHLALDKLVAIKVLAPGMAQRRELAAQFVVEARAACRARHPAVVDVTDFGRLGDGRDFLVMEYVPWPTLAGALQDGPWALPRVLSLSRGIAEGLQAAHDHGVVHRDLKPSNVFVGPQAQVKIADFGLAQTHHEEGPLEHVKGRFGTPHYMAPEQAEGGPLDHRADIYSFGCILHQMITGTKPFDGLQAADVLKAHRCAPPPPLPGVPEPLAALVKQLLAKRPDERPGSMSQVIHQLDDIRGDLP